MLLGDKQRVPDEDVQQFKILVDMIFEKINAKKATELNKVSDELCSYVDDCFRDFVVIRDWEWD
jgi:hypothetical protein